MGRVLWRRGVSEWDKEGVGADGIYGGARMRDGWIAGNVRGGSKRTRVLT